MFHYYKIKVNIQYFYTYFLLNVNYTYDNFDYLQKFAHFTQLLMSSNNAYFSEPYIHIGFFCDLEF